MNIFQLVDSICSGYVPNINEVVSLLNANEPETSYIFDAADNITRKYCSNKIHIRGIIEFSNYCRCSCAYCGLNAENQELKRYRMDPQEIIHVAREAWDAGYRTCLLYTSFMVSCFSKNLSAPSCFHCL